MNIWGVSSFKGSNQENWRQGQGNQGRNYGNYNREAHDVRDGNYNRDNNFNRGNYGNRNDRNSMARVAPRDGGDSMARVEDMLHKMMRMIDVVMSTLKSYGVI